MKKVYIIIIITITLSNVCNVISQPVTQEWVRTYNGTSNGTDVSLFNDIDDFGNIYCSGRSNQDHIAVIKYSSAGTQQWVAYYDDPNTNIDMPKEMAVDKAGNVYITGYTGDLFNQIYDAITIKYNTNGIQQWVKYYTGIGGNDTPGDIIIDKNNDIYVCGRSSSQVMLLKYNSAGDTIWTKRYSVPNYVNSSATCMAIDSSNNVILGGHCNEISGAAGNILVIKYSPGGNLLWSAVYNSGGFNTPDATNAIGVDLNNNVILCGFTEYNAKSTVIKYNTQGIQQWIRKYINNSYANDLAVDNYNNIYITGKYSTPPYGHIITYKYNTNGDSIWLKSTSNVSDEGKKITKDHFNNIYVSGYNYNSLNGSNDIMTLKYNQNGILLWNITFDGNGNSSIDDMSDLKLDIYNSIVITGSTNNSTSNSDFLTIKYSQPNGVVLSNNKIPNDFKLHQNYPNPFNPVTTIRFDVGASTSLSNRNVRLVIFNSLGQEIETLINSELKPGEYEVTWNAENFPSGVYYYQLQAGGFIETRKMMLLK